MLEAAEGVTPVPPSKADKLFARESIIMDYLNENNTITNSDVRDLLHVSSATANRVLNTMADEGMLVRFRSGRTWAYRKR